MDNDIFDLVDDIKESETVVKKQENTEKSVKINEIRDLAYSMGLRGEHAEEYIKLQEKIASKKDNKLTNRIK